MSLEHEKKKKSKLSKSVTTDRSVELLGSPAFPSYSLLIQIIVQTEKIALKPAKTDLKKSAWRWYVN